MLRHVIILAAVASCALNASAQNPAPKPALPETPTAVLTETVGLLAGTQMYQTYLNIGLIADARAESVYPTAESELLLDSVYEPLIIIEKQLAKVSKLKGMTKEDVQALEQLVKIASLLREQGSELKLFWNSGKEEHSKKYEAARQKSWSEIETLLDLKPKTEAAPAPKDVGKEPEKK